MEVSTAYAPGIEVRRTGHRLYGGGSGAWAEEKSANRAFVVTAAITPSRQRIQRWVSGSPGPGSWLLIVSQHFAQWPVRR